MPRQRIGLNRRAVWLAVCRPLPVRPTQRENLIPAIHPKIGAASSRFKLIPPFEVDQQRRTLAELMRPNARRIPRPPYSSTRQGFSSTCETPNQHHPKYEG
jgi:hypothetical protein